MEIAKHTQGPWKIEIAANGLPSKIVAPDGSRGPGGIIDVTRPCAISMPGSDEGKANARLIAAAPELLDALRSIVALHNDAVFICGSDDEAMVNHAVNKAMNAIAKVGGDR